MSFYHHSQRQAYRTPQGAVPCGQTLTLALDALNEQACCIKLCRHTDQETVVMDGVSQPIEGGVRWTFTLQAPREPGLCWYDFEVEHQGHRHWYGAPTDGLGGEGVLRDQAGRTWQITVYEPGGVPRWPSQGIMYQIYVDRFCSGRPQEAVRQAPDGALIHAHWDDTPCYVRDTKGNVVRWDFFGGDLWGVIDKLDELAEMGVTILYLNPVFLSSSNHKYDTADYRRVDPMYGGEEALRALAQAAKSRGMALLLDGVFSHTGSDSLYFNQLGRFDSVGASQSQASPYASWYRFTHWPDAYECWWGVKTMPNVNEMDPGYLAYQLTDRDSTVRRWMAMGVSGWRLDVADELPDAFLRQLKSVVSEEDSQGFVLGEVWEDASNKVSYGQRRAYLMGRELDSVTNYPFRNGLTAFLLGKQDGAGLVRLMASLKENYPQAQFYNLMNMTGTHDTVRLMTLLGEAPAPEQLDEQQKGQYRLPERQRVLARRRVALFAAILFTHPGIPTVYYGDEAGMEGYADPYNRGPYPWGREDGKLKGHFTQMAALRHREQLLKDGEYFPLAPAQDVYGHCRRAAGQGEIYTLINRGGTARGVTLPAKAAPLWTLAGADSGALWQNEAITVTLQPFDWIIFKLA